MRRMSILLSPCLTCYLLPHPVMTSMCVSSQKAGVKRKEGKGEEKEERMEGRAGGGGVPASCMPFRAHLQCLISCPCFSASLLPHTYLTFSLHPVLFCVTAAVVDDGD